MKIKLDNNNRIIGWCAIGGMDGNVVQVQQLPDGQYTDYLFIDGQYVYSPLAKTQEDSPAVDLQERVKQLQQQNESLLQCLLEMSEIVYA